MINETINGVSFEDWAAACGNLMQGMSEEEVMHVLGLETPVWQDTMEKWNTRLAELMERDMGVATLYGDIFAHPKRGRFAHVAGPAVDMETVLRMVPDYDAYQKIFWHQSVAAQHGTDPVTVLAGYGLDLGKWGQLNMHYLNWQNEHLHNEDAASVIATMQKWRAHFEQRYADDGVDLGGDISF